MTIVFGGIDLPVLELLFIVSVLLLAGLFVMILGIFYVLKELKELKGLLKKEEDNITLFEKDIKELEEFNSRDNSIAQLKKYIKYNLSRGYKWETLREHLKSQGWNEKQLEEIYKNTK